jgi:hypothetical protein
MAADLIRYDLLVQNALRGVVRKVLAKVAARGDLPGDHHFMISFRTDAPGVKISRRLAEQWPQEMTIILQHQYSNLSVDDVGFAVTLSFRSVAEALYVPFSAVRSFTDPSVEFQLKFNVEGEEDEAEAPQRRRGPVLVRPEEDAPAPPAPAPAPAKAEAAKAEAPAEAVKDAGDKIVSIDAFRKKP